MCTDTLQCDCTDKLQCVQIHYNVYRYITICTDTLQCVLKRNTVGVDKQRQRPIYKT